VLLRIEACSKTLVAAIHGAALEAALSCCRASSLSHALTICSAERKAKAIVTVHQMLEHANFTTTMKLDDAITVGALDNAMTALGDALSPSCR
jgi:hypothetical protein